MGEGDRHLAVRVRQQGTTMRGVAFGRGEWAEQLQSTVGPISVTFAPVINTFNGFNKVELHLIDWKPAASVQQAAG
jgi:single-stranded-DNA-specific exonuclease